MYIANIDKIILDLSPGCGSATKIIALHSVLELDRSNLSFSSGVLIEVSFNAETKKSSTYMLTLRRLDLFVMQVKLFFASKIVHFLA